MLKLVFRLRDNTVKRRHEGTGLGLPLVDRMMRLHGGVFELDSEEGKGTTARVQFPAERLTWFGPDQNDAITQWRLAIEGTRDPPSSGRTDDRSTI